LQTAFIQNHLKVTKLHGEEQPDMEAQNIPWTMEVLTKNTRLKFYHY